jgi:hypothetical protein
LVKRGGRGGAELSLCGEGTTKGRRGDDDGGDDGAPYARETTRLTGGAGLPVKGARERGAGRWGWLISERE